MSRNPAEAADNDELDRLLETLHEKEIEHHGHSPEIDPATGKYDCFGRQSEFFPSERHRNPCGYCRCGALDCNRQGYRLQRIKAEPHSASVIVFPASAKLPHTPEVETPAASEAAPATDATEPAVGFTFDSTGFVDALKKYKRMDVAAILANLVTLSNTIRPMKAETRYPFDLQCNFLAASLELNTRGMIPLLRPVARGKLGGSKVATTPDDIAYFNHQRLVDLDYLAKHHPHGRGVIFEKLLNDDGTLDCAKALKWVSILGCAEKKTELLQLTPHEQAELFIIRDNQTRKRWERLQTNKRKDTTKINATLRRGRKPGTADQYWQLYALCVLLDWEVRAVADASTRCPTLNMSARTVRRNYDWLKGFMVGTTDHSAAS